MLEPELGGSATPLAAAMTAAALPGSGRVHSWHWQVAGNNKNLMAWWLKGWRGGSRDGVVALWDGVVAQLGWRGGSGMAWWVWDGMVAHWGGLLDRSTARYFYKRLKTSLHKPRGNLVEILFYKKMCI
jgi:hypothetical protein